MRLFAGGRRAWPVEAVCRVCLGVAVIVYSVVFCRLTFGLYDHYQMMAFDLGIFDQATWLISRGQAPFVTVRGLHLLGDHFSALLYLLAPLYWLWDSPKTLLLAQTAALASGALPVYGLACRRIGSAPAALAFAAAYLLYPAMQWSNTYEFHPDTLATPLLLAAFYFLQVRRWPPYFVMLILAALTKETAGISIIMVGLYALFFHRRVGGLTVALGAASVVAAMAAIRHFNGGSPSPYPLLYAHYGETLPAVASYLLRHPLAAWGALNVEPHREYLRQLLVPLLFLPLFAPEVLVLAAPALLANLFSSDPFMHGIEEHYTALITPFLFAAAIIGCGRLCRRGGPFVATALVVNLGLWAFGGVFWGPLVREQKTIYPSLSASEVREADELLSHVPPGASVSAQMALGPHLSHRAEIYTYPNPFSHNAWGGSRHALREIKSINGAALDPSLNEKIAAAPVEYVALCPQTISFPLSPANFSRCTTALLRSHAYGLVAVGRSTALLRRGADHAAGLWRLEQRSGIRIRNDQDVAKAFQGWAANQPAAPN